MRLNPSTSGGAAESTSSMYACNPPEGPSTCQRRCSTALLLFYPHRGCYLFDDPVTCLMTRLPGYVFERGLFQTPPCSLLFFSAAGFAGCRRLRLTLQYLQTKTLQYLLSELHER